MRGSWWKVGEQAQGEGHGGVGTIGNSPVRGLSSVESGCVEEREVIGGGGEPRERATRVNDFSQHQRGKKRCPKGNSRSLCLAPSHPSNHS